METIFGRGVYVDENTSQSASVELVCQWQTNYARSRLQNLAKKAEGLFRQAEWHSPEGECHYLSISNIDPDGI